MDALTLNILIASIVLLFFMIRGASYFREIKDGNTYFLYDRKLYGKEYSLSFAAASTSLASVFFFFVAFGVSHGLFVLLSPITYAMGAWFYWKFMLPPLESINKYCCNFRPSKYIFDRIIYWSNDFFNICKKRLHRLCIINNRNCCILLYGFGGVISSNKDR